MVLTTCCNNHPNNHVFLSERGQIYDFKSDVGVIVAGTGIKSWAAKTGPKSPGVGLVTLITNNGQTKTSLPRLPGGYLHPREWPSPCIVIANRTIFYGGGTGE